MAKITYYLGAGSSFYSCPILNQLSEIMIKVAKIELTERNEVGDFILNYKFEEYEKGNLPENNRVKILWHIGYFGKKGIIFNTIDTYARKLELIGDITNLDLLKMSLSVFFDLWENFHSTRYKSIINLNNNKSTFESIDRRYISLFSILLNKNETGIKFDKNIKFISWNYDLQLESTFKMFTGQGEVNDFEELNQNHFRFKGDNQNLVKNNVFHLNGHRGFYSNFSFDKLRRKEVETNPISTIEDYWESISSLFEDTVGQISNFNKNMKYAWEHQTSEPFFDNLVKIMNQTEVLVVIGYSFPPFNRAIDQFLFSKLNHKKIKRIVYQDPLANEEIIENLFINPSQYKDKIEIEKSNISQFYLPNEFFIKRPFRSPFSSVTYH